MKLLRSIQYKNLFRFIGPAFLVSIGYMDPGNWSTDLAGGANFGYKLIFVLVFSNIMAILLQNLATRIGVIKGKNLAEVTAAMYPAWMKYILYGMAELSIMATDIAEIIGTTIAFKLLFDIPIHVGLWITLIDTFIFFAIMKLGMRKIEIIYIFILLILLASFGYLIYLSKPAFLPILKGFIPQKLNFSELYIALGIIGATVMPHNLYLHSSLVQKRVENQIIPKTGIKKILKFYIIDNIVALNMAFLINVSILILAACLFNNQLYHQVSTLQEAHYLLNPLLGSVLAPILFALALLISGQSSTFTATLTGQVVMEGFLNLKIKPVYRRLFTRLLAIIPTFIVVGYFGENKVEDILVFSQVFLSIQLGLTMIPLIHSVSLKKYLEKWTISTLHSCIIWMIAIVLISLNISIIFNLIKGVFSVELLVGFGIFYIFVICYTLVYPLLNMNRNVVLTHSKKISINKY